MTPASASRDGAEARLPTMEDYKSMIVKAKLFRDGISEVRRSGSHD